MDFLRPSMPEPVATRGEPFGEALGPPGRLPNQPHSQLAHDGQQLSLDAGPEPPPSSHVLGDEWVKALHRSLQDRELSFVQL